MSHWESPVIPMTAQAPQWQVGVQGRRGCPGSASKHLPKAEGFLLFTHSPPDVKALQAEVANEF